MSEHDSKLSRRDLLKAAGIAGMGFTAARIVNANSEIEGAERPQSKQQTMIGVKFQPRDVVRIGIVGVGLRGTSVLGDRRENRPPPAALGRDRPAPDRRTEGRISAISAATSS